MGELQLVLVRYFSINTYFVNTLYRSMTRQIYQSSPSNYLSLLGNILLPYTIGYSGLRPHTLWCTA